MPSQSQADSVNAAAAVAQSAIQQLQAAKEIKKQVGHCIKNNKIEGNTYSGELYMYR